jgi:hypothetical protein
MTRKLLPLVDAFRAILRTTHPERADLQQIDSLRWFHARKGLIDDRGRVFGDQKDRPAYEAYEVLKADVKSQKIRLHGCLNGALPADINPIDASEGELGVFAGTLKIYQGKGTFRTARTYTSVHCYAVDLPMPKGKGGRKPIVDWQVVFVELERLMDHHNEFSPDDPEWNAQARLVEALQKFCSDKFGIEPDKNTIEGRIKEPLAIWREQLARCPKT